MLAKQRVFDEALLTNAWLANLEERPDWYENHESVSSYFVHWRVEAVAVVRPSTPMIRYASGI